MGGFSKGKTPTQIENTRPQFAHTWFYTYTGREGRKEGRKERKKERERENIYIYIDIDIDR